MLRVAQREDSEEIAALFSTRQSNYPPPDRIEAAGSLERWIGLHNQTPRWVWQEDRILGYVQIVSTLRESFLDLEQYYSRAFPGDNPRSLVLVQRLFVDPAARGRGIGKELLRVASLLGKDLGLVSAVAEQQNTAARHLFGSYGWQEVNFYQSRQPMVAFRHQHPSL